MPQEFSNEISCQLSDDIIHTTQVSTDHTRRHDYWH